MMNIFLLVLDSVRRDHFSYVSRNFLEIKNDFVEFSNCKSIYTETPRSFYTIFFGDYFNSALNNNLFSQLKKKGYSIKSFCNGGVILLYPLMNIYEEPIQGIRPFRDEIIQDLVVEPEFMWNVSLFGNALNTYYGAADDEEREIPKKWKNYLHNIQSNDNIIFFHFWKTHHNYDINSILAEPIMGDNYNELGQNLINQLKSRKIKLSTVNNQYQKIIQSTYDNYILEIFQILKNKGVYDNSLIIITADHGEGLGDIGFEGNYYYFYKKFLHNIHKFLKNTAISTHLSQPPYKWDMTTFFHAGDFELQKEVPLWIKFPNNEFSGTKYNKPVTLFDIIHTINDELGYVLNVNPNRGTSLKALLKYGDKGRDKYLIKVKMGLN